MIPLDSEENYYKLCFPRYRNFRFPPGHDRQYEYTMQYWHVIAAKMAFIIVVEVGTDKTGNYYENTNQ